MTALDDVERRSREWIGRVELATVAPIRRQDLQTWAAVTHDEPLAQQLQDAKPVEVSPMYLVGQLQPGPWPSHTELRADGLAPRDSPGARTEDPVAVLHGGGSVAIHDWVREGVSYRVRRQYLDVERKGRPGQEFLRVTLTTSFTSEGGVLVAEYEEFILLREFPT